MTNVPSFTQKTTAIISFALVVFLLSFLQTAYTQMRQIYVDDAENNEVRKFSFYSPAEGFVAFNNWIGFTTDSGHTFTKKYITQTNVDYGLNSVNLTFGFRISGVKAFDQNNILVYGDYGIVPSILYSTDGGNSFKLVYHSSYNLDIFDNSIVDMVFPQNGTIGFAVDADRILRTTNRGLTWSVMRTQQRSDLSNLEAIDDNTVFAFSTANNKYKLLKSTNTGLSWTNIVLPTGALTYAYFRTATIGWVSSVEDVNYRIYKTVDGGATWTIQNDPEATPFSADKMRFTDDNIGYALGSVWGHHLGQNVVFKTKDGGKMWEPLARDNNFSYLGYSHNDLHFWGTNQFWAGGGHGFIELTSNAGGSTLPISYYEVDTVGLSISGTVNLVNYSGAGHNYRWFLNGAQISTSYHASYAHDIFRTRDTVQLIVSNGAISDTTTRYQNFYPPVIINSFTPTIAGTGNTVTIKGINFTSVLAVRFGNTPATSYTVVSPTTITAVVGPGTSGNVSVFTATGSASVPGFTYLPPPIITSFTPSSAVAGTSVTISGANFTNVTTVKIGGINTSFSTVSTSTITAVVPSGPSGSISVTTSGGTTSLAGFINLPKVVSFTPLTGTEGTVMTIKGTSLADVSAVNVGGIPVSSFTIKSADTIIAIVGSGASGAVDVIKTGGIASLSGFTWIAAPTITSFSPTVGPVGTSVTITGSGFDQVSQNNTVFFGPVKAAITGGNANSLTVTVPVGATFDLISITSNKLIAYTNKPFVVSFPGGGSITERSFDSTFIINTGSANRPMNIHFADLDGDQKTDLIVPTQDSTGAGSIYLYRNTGTTTTISFANPVKLNNLDYKGVATGDFNGDGKLDLAIVNKFSVSIYRNTSSPGVISFSSDVALATPNEVYAVAINDLDGDGKTDVATINFPEKASVFRNIGEPTSIRFAAPINFDVPAGNNIVLSDLDDDKKPELIVQHGWENTYYVFKNNSTKGNISLGAPLAFTGYVASLLANGDIDGDGKTDLAATNESVSQLGIMRNISTAAKIELSQPVEFPTLFYPKSMAISDLDGDGKPDIAVTLANYSLAAFKNLSTPGNLVVAAKSDFVAGNFSGARIVRIADINGDGKSDPVVISESGRTITVHINDVTNEPFIYSFTPTVGDEGTEVTIDGENFNGATAVSFGGTPAKSFVINSQNRITAVVDNGGTGVVAVTNTAGTARLPEFVFGPPAPVISSFSPRSAAVMSTVTISGRNFSVQADSNRVFFGGAKAKVLSATTSSLVVAVPFGSMYDFIKVTTGGLTASSQETFITTFTGGGTLNESSFAPRFYQTGLATNCVADMDLDGKPDLVTASSVTRNTSISGNISFGATEIFILGDKPGRPIVMDFDGDGKIDVASMRAAGILSVVRNTSTPGSLSFSTNSEFNPNIGVPAPGIDASDFDGDGKPDFVTYNQGSGLISVVRNVSNRGEIKFGAQTNRTTDGFSFVLAVDLDTDGKTDLLASHGGNQRFSFFRNISSPGNISFNAKVTITLPAASALGLIIYDADNDGRKDIFITGNGTMTLYRNTSTPGNVSFVNPVSLPYSPPKFASINDYDGDGMVDITSDFYVNTNCIFKNTSGGGNISFLPIKNPEYADVTTGSMSADMDSDGRPDIVNNSGNGISIYRNQVGGNGPIISSFAPVSGTFGDTIIITGTDLTNTSAVTFGDIPAASFKVESATMIKAVLGLGQSGNVVVKTPAGLGSKYGFIYSDKPILTSVWPLLATSPGTMITITGANLKSITSVNFGGIEASSFTVVSSDIIQAIVGNGSSGNVQLLTGTDTLSYPGFVFALAPTIVSFTPTSVRNGYPSYFTIYGSNFSSATSVLIGGFPTPFTVVSSTQIEANYTGGAASGDVTVITPAGIASKGGLFLQEEFPLLTSFFPTSGSAGSTVTIYGQNLGAVKSIMFGNVPAASFRIVSSAQIIAVVGNGNSGDVTVENHYRKNAIAGFTFIPVTVPFITTVIPSIGASGKPVEISGQNFMNVNAVSFGGKSARSFIINSPTSITATVDSGSSGDVIVGSAAGSGKYSGFVFATWPIIDSFVPISAKPGDEVVIYGSNFKTDNTSNIVYFGNVKAAVSFASADMIKVKVPTGAIFSPISVTAGALTGYSQTEFLPTFSGIGRLTPASFPARTDSISSSEPSCLVLPDVDGDGYPDIAISNHANETINANLTVYRNSGVAQEISFSPRYKQTDNHAPHQIKFADFNGDGKLDILMANTPDVNGLNVYPNNSTPGKISFGTKVTLMQSGLGPYNSAMGDFDNDGKMDVAATGYYQYVYLLRNKSTNGVVSFERIILDAGRTVHGIVGDDIDGDGRTDIVLAGNGFIQVFKNMSSQGVFNFVMLPPIKTSDYCHQLVTGDIDADGKPDIVGIGGVVNIIRNISSPEVILFEPAMSLTAGNKPAGVNLSDLDGNGKPDIIVANVAENSISIFSNLSQKGRISFDTKIVVPVNSPPSFVSVASMDGDEKPDIVLANPLANSVSVLRNMHPALSINSVNTISVCTNGNVSIISDKTGATYQWQVNTGSGFINLSNDNIYSGVNTSTLQIGTIAQGWNNYEYRCIVNGSIISQVSKLSVTQAIVPSISITTPTSTVCAGSAVAFSATVVNGGDVPSYVWQVNGVNTGGNSNSFNTTTLTQGAKVKAILTSNAQCASPATVESNVIEMTVNAAVAPSAVITASPSAVCPGTNVTFTASVTNEGPIPVYQWKRNGINVGTNSKTYSSNSLQNGDVISMLLTSNTSCAAPVSAVSNEITITIPAIPGDPQISISGADTVLQGQSALVLTNTSNPGSSPTFEWQDSTNTHGWQAIAGAFNTSLDYQPSQSGDKIRCIVTSNAACVNQPKDTSNTLVFTVTNITAIDPVPGSHYNIRLYPNPVTSILIIDTLKISDRWYSLQITTIDGRKLLSKDITNQTLVALDVSRLPAGLYFAILTRRSGESAYLKFIKK